MGPRNSIELYCHSCSIANHTLLQTINYNAKNFKTNFLIPVVIVAALMTRKNAHFRSILFVLLGVFSAICTSCLLGEYVYIENSFLSVITSGETFVFICTSSNMYLYTLRGKHCKDIG